MITGFMVATMTWLTVTEYLCHKWPRKCSVCHNHICSHSWLITRFVTRVTRRVPHVLQELLTHEFTPVVSEVHVGQSLVFCVVYCRLSFVLLSSFFWPLCCLFFFDLRLLIIPFDHCIVCPSIYDFWLLLLTIVLSVLLRSTTSDYPFWPLHCLSFDLRLLITPWFLQVFLKKSYRNNGPGNDCRLWLEKCEEACDLPFWLPLWYLQTFLVGHCIACHVIYRSDYPFDIFKLFVANF